VERKAFRQNESFAVIFHTYVCALCLLPPPTRKKVASVRSRNFFQFKKRNFHCFSLVNDFCFLAVAATAAAATAAVQEKMFNGETFSRRLKVTVLGCT
jgi:hypothetical protein